MMILSAILSSCMSKEEIRQAMLYDQKVEAMFPKGSIVQFKSGGPKMIVSDIRGVCLAVDYPRVVCVWMDSKDGEQWDVFDYKLLKRIE